MAGRKRAARGPPLQVPGDSTKVICTNCGGKKKRTTYYNTCHKGISCQPLGADAVKETHVDHCRPALQRVGPPSVTVAHQQTEDAAASIADSLPARNVASAAEGGQAGLQEEARSELNVVAEDVQKSSLMDRDQGCQADAAAADNQQAALESESDQVTFPPMEGLEERDAASGALEGDCSFADLMLADEEVDELEAGEEENGRTVETEEPSSSHPENAEGLEKADPADVETEGLRLLQIFDEQGDDAVGEEMVDEVEDDLDGELTARRVAVAAFLRKHLQKRLAEAPDAGDDAGEEELEEQKEQQGCVERGKTWHQRRLEPLYYEADGAPSEKSVLVAAMEALHEKHVFGYKDAAVNAQCKRVASTLRQPNQFPPSLYALKQVVGVEPLQKYEEHVCINGCQEFPTLPAEEWLDHKDDECGVCGALRFEAYKTKRGLRVRAVSPFYCMGLENVIKDLFEDREFCKLEPGKWSKRRRCHRGVWELKRFRRTTGTLCCPMG